MSSTNKIILLILSIVSFAIAQPSDYKYQSEILGVKEQWHKIILTDKIIGKITPEMYDLRIIGLNNSNDTTEIPYLLKYYDDKINDKKVSYSLINLDNNKKDFSYIFKTENANTINKLKLDFNIANFKWKVSLEGSNNQKNWEGIFSNYKIIAIDNELTTFKQTTIEFPNSKFQYLKLTIKADSNPQLNTALFTYFDINKGNYKIYGIETLNTNQDKKKKQTVVDICLKYPAPINRIKFFFNNKLDYNRQFQLEYLYDSNKTAIGMEYNYNLLCENTVNSNNKNEFNFTNKYCQKLRLTIDNNDNAPLKLDSMQIEGYLYELIARFTDFPKYYLLYGKINETKPIYDIVNFENKIPNVLLDLNLGNEVEIKLQKVKEIKSNSWLDFLTNPILLWGVMGLIIVIIGWFTLKMLKKS